MANPIGFIGLGNMGEPMVRNLALSGRKIIALDKSPERRALLHGSAGVRTTEKVRDLASCDVIIFMLPNGHIVKDILIGSENLADALPNGALVIDMSSSDPVIYEELLPILQKRQIDIIDAPVSGNVSGAEASTLTIMSGGNEAALVRARPILELMGKAIFQTGALGSGQTMKALNNLLSAGGLMMAAEILLTAKAAGLDPKQVNDILNVSTGRNNSTERKIEPFVLSGAFNSGFGLSLMAKDLRTAASIAERSGVKLTLSGKAVKMANEAENDLGPLADHTEVARWIERATGQSFGKVSA